MASRFDKIRDYYNSIHRTNKIQTYYNGKHRDNQIKSFYDARTAAARSYYDAALDDPTAAGKQIAWSNSPTLSRPWLSNTLKLGAQGVGLYYGASRLSPLLTGRSLADNSVSGIRAFEEYFLARIPRTLQLSNIASQWESAAQKSRMITAGQLKNYSAGQVAYLSKLTGQSSYDLLREGIEFKRGKLAFAASGKTILEHASVIRNINKSHHFSSAYARSLGVKVHNKLFGESLSFMDHTGNEVSEIFQFAGGHSKGQHIARELFGWGTEFVERANRLARAPSGFPVIGPILKKVFGRHTLGVESRGGLETLARLTGKLGLIGGSAILGYETADWAVRKAKIFNNTIFDQGISAGLGQIWAKTNLAYSGFGDATGWTQSKKHQEQYAPGSTSLLKLAAFPILGAFGMASHHYLLRTATIARAQLRGHSVEKASEIAERLLRKFEGSGIISTLGRTFRNSKSSIIRSLAESPLTTKMALGFGLGAIPILPFLFNAIGPSHSEKELHDIYTGKQEVAVKKNRWWSLGRCNASFSWIKTSTTSHKLASDISLEDKLIGSDGNQHKIIEIYKREYVGKILKFKTSLDRNIETSVTPNHIIPVIKEFVNHWSVVKNKRPLIEAEASELQIGDFVQVPLPILSQDINTIDISNYIKSGLFMLENDIIYTAQHSKSGKVVKSGGNSFKNTLPVNYDIGLLFGYFMSEGNLSFRYKSDLLPSMIELTFAKHEMDYIQDIENICKKYFGVSITYKFCKPKKVGDEGCWKVRICNALISRLIFALFYNNDLQSDKIFPEEFLNYSTEFKNGLIEGYWRGDGNYDHKRHVIKSARKHLLDGIKILLLGQGIVPSIPVEDITTYIKKDRINAIGYKISWTANLFYTDGPGHMWRDGKLYSRIISIEEEEYDGVVYDFEIDHEDHLLQNGTFLVHNSPYEGTSTAYYRENWLPRLLHRGKEKSIWGPLEGDNEFSPVKKFFESNFTYNLERAHYRDRPYPVSAKPFFDIPIVGPLLSATVGRIVKPPMYMHENEFYNSGSGQYVQMPLGFGADRATGMGEQMPGNPISPTGFKSVVGEQAYRMTQLGGLPGFLMTLIKKKITGTPDLFDQQTQLASADTINSAARGYWDMNLGDLGGQNEFFRRLLPHARNNVDLYNPIKNDMPSWMPGPGQRGPDFQHGDPYASIPEGEIRLPGAGFAAMHPELKGVDPEDYPLIYKYKILGDVAPFTDAFGDVEQQAALAFKDGKFSQDELDIYHQTQDQIKERRNKRTFYDYKYRKENLNSVQKALADYNNSKKDPKTEPSWFEKTLGSYWETLAHNAETPLEFITPLSPAMKLLHMRTALEDYKKTQIFGTESAFWDRPIGNFIKPFVNSTLHMLGSDKVPGAIRDKRKLEEYFDMLKYIKFTRLKGIAQKNNDKEASSEFESKRRETLFGLNPYTFNYSEIFRALPRRDRDYFNEFVDTKDMNKRGEILKMVPENEKGLFVAKWQQTDATDFARAVKLGLLKGDEIAKGQEQVKQMYKNMETEGLPKSDDLWQEYIKTRSQGESYPDWYRRAKLLPQKAKELGVNIPGPDFVGFNPNVDLDDVKLKVVENLGETIQDYDLWPTREKQLLYKQKYINDQSIAPVEQPNKSSESDIRGMIQKILTDFNIKDAHVDVAMSGGNNNHVNMDIQEDRERELKERIRANN